MVGTRGAYKHVAALIRKGYLRKGRGARALEVIAQSLQERTVPSKSSGRAIPILGKVAAGQPIFAEENLLGHLTVDPSLVRGREAFLLKVKVEVFFLYSRASRRRVQIRGNDGLTLVKEWETCYGRGL